jgi:hypothetical protein
LVTVTAHKKGDFGTLQNQTNEQGNVSFGMLPWGQYDLTVFLKALNIQHRHSVFLRPGNSVPEKIVCPADVPVSTLKFDVQPPEFTPQVPLALICEVFPGSFQVAGLEWEIAGDRVMRILLDRHGQPVGKVKSQGITDVAGEPAEQVEVEPVSGPVRVIGNLVAIGLKASPRFPGSTGKNLELAMNGGRQGGLPSLQSLKADATTGVISVSLPSDSPIWAALGMETISIPRTLYEYEHEYEQKRTHSLRFVDDRSHPVQGVQVTFRSQMHASFVHSQPVQTSDAAGQVEFSLSARETAFLQFQLPQGETSAFVTVTPDFPKEKTVVVPAFRTATQALAFEFVVPESPVPSDWLFDLEIERLPVTVNGIAWTAPERAGESEATLPRNFRLLVKREGTVMGRILGDQAVPFSSTTELKLQAVPRFPGGEYALRAMRICREQNDQALNPEGDLTVVFLTRMAKVVEGTSSGPWLAGGQGSWPVEVPRLLAERALRDVKDE